MPGVGSNNWSDRTQDVRWDDWDNDRTTGGRDGEKSPSESDRRNPQYSDRSTLNDEPHRDNRSSNPTQNNRYLYDDSNRDTRSSNPKQNNRPQAQSNRPQAQSNHWDDDWDPDQQSTVPTNDSIKKPYIRDRDYPSGKPSDWNKNHEDKLDQRNPNQGYNSSAPVSGKNITIQISPSPTQPRPNMSSNRTAPVSQPNTSMNQEKESGWNDWDQWDDWNEGNTSKRSVRGKN